MKIIVNKGSFLDKILRLSYEYRTFGNNLVTGRMLEEVIRFFIIVFLKITVTISVAYCSIITLYWFLKISNNNYVKLSKDPIFHDCYLNTFSYNPGILMIGLLGLISGVIILLYFLFVYGRKFYKYILTKIANNIIVITENKI